MCGEFTVFDVEDVSTGELKTIYGKGLLRAVAIGSCIVISCYHHAQKIGVMSHVMLPGRSPAASAMPTKYAENAIEEIDRIFSNHRCFHEDVDICLIGAGNVLHKSDDFICGDNIESVTSTLQKYGYKPAASALGGFDRKSVKMYVDKGVVYITRGDEKEQLLWRHAPKTAVCLN